MALKNKWHFEIGVMLCASALVLAVLIIAATTFPKAGTGEYRLALIETSDVHGTLTRGEKPDYEYYYAFIADKIEDVRRTDDGLDPDRLVLLDGGDIYQGSATSLLSEGEAMSAAYDDMKYDAVALGNHEFDWGIDKVVDSDRTMRDYEEDGKTVRNEIPVICSNMYKDGKKIDFADDYVILTKEAVDADGTEKQVRVGVIGFAEEYSMSIPAKKFSDLGYTIIEDYDAVNSMAADLKSAGRCDAVVLLSHGDPVKAAEGLGESSCVDLVLGGHIHKNNNDTTDSGLRYLSPGGGSSAYVYDELVFENDGFGGLRIKKGADDKARYNRLPWDGSQLMDTEENSEELDHETVDISNEYIEKADKYLSREVGYITENVTKDPIEGSGQRVTSAGNFICDALRTTENVDVAFINKSGVRSNLYLADGHERRDVTLYDLFSMMPFDDRLYEYEMTYGDLKNVIDFSLNGGGWALLTNMSGIDCYFVDDPDSVPGSKYAQTMVDALVKDGELIYHNGKWMEGWEDKKVRVCVNDLAAEAEADRAGTLNPLYAMNDTDKLLSNDILVRDAMIKGLEIEAKAAEGHLHVNDDTCFKYRAYNRRRMSPASTE